MYSSRQIQHHQNIPAVSSLPTELISKIFSYLHFPTDPTPISSLPTKVIDDLLDSFHLPGTPSGRSLLASSGTGSHPAWLQVAHVCHQWREIALHCGSLVHFPHLNASGPRVNRFKMELLTQISQIFHLSISAEDYLLESIFEVLSSPAPALAHLSLSQPNSSDGNVSRVTIPNILFGGGNTPRLISLELYNLDIDSQSPLLWGLTRGLKYLDTRTQGGTPNPSFAEWLDVLREMPQLEQLILHSCAHTTPPSPSTSDIEQSITLPHLIHLDISAAAGNCVLALTHLSLPTLTKLCVASDAGDISLRGNIQDIFPPLLQHANGPQDVTPLQSMLIVGRQKHLTVLACPVPNINIGAYGSESFTTLSAALSPRVVLTVTSQDPIDPGTQRHLLDGAMAVLPLTGIVTLTINHHAHLNEQFWCLHAPQWSLLQCMRLGSQEFPGFIEVLLQDNSDPNSNSPLPPLLPSLTTLVLINVAFNAQKTLHLCDALMKHVEEGVPLGNINLSLCFATNDSVQLLSEIVVNVLHPMACSPPASDEEDSDDDDSDDESHTTTSDESLDQDEEDTDYGMEDEDEGTSEED